MDLITAQAHLNAWLDADLKLAEMESYSFTTPSGQQTVTRASACDVTRKIKYWQSVVNQLQGSGGAANGFALADFS